jgi:hypothetical protein
MITGPQLKVDVVLERVVVFFKTSGSAVGSTAAVPAFFGVCFCLLSERGARKGAGKGATNGVGSGSSSGAHSSEKGANLKTRRKMRDWTSLFLTFTSNGQCQIDGAAEKELDETALEVRGS